jgi:transposase-like protein
VAAHILRLQEASIASVTVWRDAQALGRRLRQQLGPGGRQVTVLGADETYVRVRGRSVCLGVVTDAQTGETVGIQVLAEQDAAGFLRWLSPFVRELGVQVLVTDDLSTYKPVAERLGVAHQACLPVGRSASPMSART